MMVVTCTKTAILFALISGLLMYSGSFWLTTHAQVSTNKFLGPNLTMLPVGGGGPSASDLVLKVSSVITLPPESRNVINQTEFKSIEKAIESSHESVAIPNTDKLVAKPGTISSIISNKATRSPVPSPTDRYSNSTQVQPQIKNMQVIKMKVTAVPDGKKLAEAETSVASKGTLVFYTGNTYAARSTDGGRTWQYLDVNKDLNTCCDQVVIYDPHHNVFKVYPHDTLGQGNHTLVIERNGAATEYDFLS
jgi:hypothetical protein